MNTLSTSSVSVSHPNQATTTGTPRKHWSLRAKLLCLVAGTTLGLGVISWTLSQNLFRHAETEMQRAFLGAAYSLADGIGAQFYERYGDVQAFATNRTLRSNDRAEVVSLLNRWSALYGIYNLIMVVDRQGRLVAVNDTDPSGKRLEVKALYQRTYEGTPWFKAVMAGQFTEDKTNGFAGTFVEDIQIDEAVSEAIGAKTLGSSFSAALKDEQGNTVGVVSNRAHIKWIGAAFDDLYKTLKAQGYGSSEFDLVRRDGVLLYRMQPNAERTGPRPLDLDAILKLNLISQGVDSAIRLGRGEVGMGSDYNPVLKADVLKAFSPVRGSKFIEAIGWGVAVRALREEVLEGLLKTERLFYILFVSSFLLALGAGYAFARKMSISLSTIAQRLRSDSVRLESEAKRVNEVSTSLSEASTEQAAALQQTVASIDEVSAMVGKNADNAARSSSASDTSRQASAEGKQAVDEMITAIGEINRSNEEIMAQIRHSNEQIGQIVQVINEIGSKAKVINDIVFQTKLLSFNASVEAARAGEHGKGFAVVAEEVGNLARMSGQAAHEISTLLESSTQKVHGIVEETRSKVEILVEAGRKKVETGTSIAERCGATLEGILKSVSEVNHMVSEIATASKEQAQGVSEINRAMAQLDQVTQQNARVSRESALAGEELSRQAAALLGASTELWISVQGSAAGVADPTSHLSGDGSGPGDSRGGQAGHSPEASSHHTPKASEPASGGRVLAFPKAKPQVAASERGGFKAAVGASAQGPSVPSASDPRFEDV